VSAHHTDDRDLITVIEDGRRGAPLDPASRRYARRVVAAVAAVPVMVGSLYLFGEAAAWVLLIVGIAGVPLLGACWVGVAIVSAWRASRAAAPGLPDATSGHTPAVPSVMSSSGRPAVDRDLRALLDIASRDGELPPPRPHPTPARD
jgi:hypothetical protein